MRQWLSSSASPRRAGSDARQRDGGLAIAVVAGDQRVLPRLGGGDLQALSRLRDGLEVGRHDGDGLALRRRADDVVLEVQVAHVDVAQLDAEGLVSLPGIEDEDRGTDE